jgi:hypothetical protein
MHRNQRHPLTANEVPEIHVVFSDRDRGGLSHLCAEGGLTGESFPACSPAGAYTVGEEPRRDIHYWHPMDHDDSHSHGCNAEAELGCHCQQGTVESTSWTDRG